LRVPVRGGIVLPRPRAAAHVRGRGVSLQPHSGQPGVARGAWRSGAATDRWPRAIGAAGARSIGRRRRRQVRRRAGLGTGVERPRRARGGTGAGGATPLATLEPAGGVLRRAFALRAVLPRRGLLLRRW